MADEEYEEISLRYVISHHIAGLGAISHWDDSFLSRLKPIAPHSVDDRSVLVNMRHLP